MTSEKDLGKLCNVLIKKGIPEKDILRISRKSDVSVFTIPGTANYEWMDIAKLFTSMAVGAVVGAYVGYRNSGDLQGAVLGGVLGGIAGELGYIGMQSDRCDCEREMTGELRREYPELLK